MFCEIKSIVFKIKILACLLLRRSFGNVVQNIAANSNGLLSASDIRNLKKCYKKRNKALLDIDFLKNCKTLNVFPKFIQFDIPLAKRSDVRSIKKRLPKNALHKRCREQKNLHINLEKKIQFIRSRCDGITWFLLYESIQRNVKKEESNILKTHQKKLCNLTRNRMLPIEPYNVVTNLSKYQLSVDKMDLLKNGLEFSIPPKFLKKTDIFCQFDMIAKYMTQELDDNQTSTRLKNEL